MKTSRVISTSFRQLQINANRSWLAIASLAIGITAVIAMAAIGNGARKETLAQLEKFGTNLITVNAGKVKSVMKRKDGTDRVTTLKLKDCELIRSRCSMVNEVVPSVSGTIKIKSGNIVTQAMINGVTTPYFKIRNFDIRYGSLFTYDDNRLTRRVAVLGSQISNILFGSENPVGKTIRVGRVPFTVAGVLESKGLNAEGANLDAQVLVPVNTALRRVFNVNYLNRIFIAVVDPQWMKPAEEQIKLAMREAHQIKGTMDDFTIENQLTAIEANESASRSFTWLLMSVSAIALGIGGTGILAIMTLSVRMRFSEIGLRMSVGAKRKDIIRQFLTESTLLGFAGGIAGLLTGLIATWVIAGFSNWQISISPGSLVFSVVFSMTTGWIFGVIPARKASKTNPITALQKE